MWKRLRRAWSAFWWKDSIVFKDRNNLAAWAGQFQPVMTGYGGAVTCQFCGSIATTEDQKTKAWNDLHEPWCRTFVVLDFQEKMAAR